MHITAGLPTSANITIRSEELSPVLTAVLLPPVSGCPDPVPGSGAGSGSGVGSGSGSGVGSGY